MSRFLVALAAMCLAVGGTFYAWSSTDVPSERRSLGLVTSLPIYWSEAGSIEETLSGQGEPHWVRQQLENDYALVPLDTLAIAGSAGEIGEGLAGLDRVLLAQPAALPPADLVALDSWLRDGGTALIFADPMLTEHSRFGIGDRRRPQDVVTLDPLLARWGIALTFDPGQDPEPRVAMLDAPVAVALPVVLPGAFTRHEGPDVAGDCRIGSAGLVADCRVGKGRALIVADAALLQSHADELGGDPGSGLGRLTEAAFGA